MEIVEESPLCTVCLCADRQLYFIGETGTHHLYSQILSEIPIYDLSHITVRVCWECRAILQRLQHFKQQVKNSYHKLLQLLGQGQLSKINILKKTSRLQIHNAYSFCYPDIEDCAIKEETEVSVTKNEEDAIKVEVSYEIHHSEPDAIQNDNPVESTERKKKKKSKIKKKKSKGNVKKKKKHIILEENISDCENLDNNSIASLDIGASSDGLSDLESVLDYYVDDPEKIKLQSKSKELKVVKQAYDPSEVKLIMLNHDEMLKEREKEANSDYFVNCEHKCNDCILSFKFARTLQTHMETKHSEDAGHLKCEICKVRFNDESIVREHEAKHLRRYKCIICGKRTSLLVDMLKHTKNHKEYKCDMCGEVSGSLFRHQAHMTKEHREKPQCVDCGKMFSSKKTYRYHLNVIHKGQNCFPCPHCGKIYQWKSNLWRHIKNHKARDNGELFCAPCNKKFSSIATYQQHLKVSRRHVTENEFNYVCIDCGKRFANKTRLRDHIDWDHLHKVNYRCQLCNKPFKSNTSLYVHLQNVHKNKQEKDNLCHVCGKSYQNIAKLKYHIVAMHTSETPYSCNQCPSSFSWYSSLYRHVREVHHKVKIKKNRKLRRGDTPAAEPPHLSASVVPHQPQLELPSLNHH